VGKARRRSFVRWHSWHTRAGGGSPSWDGWSTDTGGAWCVDSARLDGGAQDASAAVIAQRPRAPKMGIQRSVCFQSVVLLNAAELVRRSIERHISLRPRRRVSRAGTGTSSPLVMAPNLVRRQAFWQAGRVRILILRTARSRKPRVIAKRGPLNLLHVWRDGSRGSGGRTRGLRTACWLAGGAFEGEDGRYVRWGQSPPDASNSRSFACPPRP
jgi:hypothetical protein